MKNEQNLMRFLKPVSAGFLFLMGAMLTVSSNAADMSDTVEVESFNLRYDNPDDGINAWDNRKEMVLEHLETNAADVISMQEALAHQVDWLDTKLANYHYIGVGRDDGKRSGEFVPLFYNHKTLKPLDSGFFWLSETPDIPGSIGWQADLPRVATWAKFSKNKRVFFVFNVHFSHVSELAREKSAEFLLRHIPTISGEHPVILMGDFNTVSSEPAYNTLLADENLGFKDAGTMNQQRPAGTYNGFGERKPASRIDYVFISRGLDASHYKTHEMTDAGRYISDHFPISVTVKL